MPHNVPRSSLDPVSALAAAKMANANLTGTLTCRNWFCLMGTYDMEKYESEP